jgi:hypothetical protein
MDNTSYTGKIINLAEFKQAQPAGIKGFFNSAKTALAYPVTLISALKHVTKHGVDMGEPKFYVAAETAGGDLPVRAENAYFEASSTIKALCALGGSRVLGKSFSKAIEKAPDHRKELAAGLLKAGAGSFSIDLMKAPKLEVFA